MRRSTWGIALLAIGAFILIVLAAGLLYIYSGAYNVAATDDLEGPTRWLLSTVTERSIEARAQPLQPPLEATPAMIREGAEHYSEMCATCHGAPGVEAGEFSEGLVPSPPDLQRAAGHISQEEIYWVVTNGIKHTAMGALAPTHSDEQIRAIVAFVQQLPDLSPQQYQQLGPETEEGEHHTEEAVTAHRH